MPRAEQTLNDLGWLERILLVLAFGPEPKNWSPFAHRLTEWRFWEQPDGEKIVVFKHNRLLTSEQKLGATPYPQSVAIDPKTKGRYPIDTSADAITHSSRIWNGTYSGEPLQMGRVDKITGQEMFRPVSYGYAEYGVHKNVPAPGVPLPASFTYEHCGGPNIASDRHVIIVEPRSGAVHELIMFDDEAHDSAFSNQALGWGKWMDGVLIAGESSTATNTAIHTRLWDRTSRERGGHELGLVLGDYVGADGTLVEGPRAGDRYYLPAESPAYKAMVALGGECKAVAESANIYGLLIVDRNGYIDSPSNTVPGTKMKSPGIGIQWGAWQRDTNLDKLNIPVNQLWKVS